MLVFPFFILKVKVSVTIVFDSILIRLECIFSQYAHLKDMFDLRVLNARFTYATGMYIITRPKIKSFIAFLEFGISGMISFSILLKLLKLLL